MNYEEFSDKQKEVISIFKKFISTIDTKRIVSKYPDEDKTPYIIRCDGNDAFYLGAIIDHISFINHLSTVELRQVAKFVLSKSYWTKAEGN